MNVKKKKKQLPFQIITYPILNYYYYFDSIISSFHENTLKLNGRNPGPH